MIRNMFLVVAVSLLVSAEETSGLAPLVLEGHELHASLVTQQIDDVARLHVRRAVLKDNPQLSTEPGFVDSIAGGGSQGQLSGEGIRAALYALYRAENELGFYGLQAASTEDAIRLEVRLRAVWAKNASLDRARVHRGRDVVVVVWTDGVSPSCWDAVNSVVAQHLFVP